MLLSRWLRRSRRPFFGVGLVGLGILAGLSFGCGEKKGAGEAKKAGPAPPPAVRKRLEPVGERQG